MAGTLLSNGVGIGIASGTTETSRVTVDEIGGTTTIIGAGTELGPARRIDMFEDVKVHGNLDVLGLVRGTRLHLPDNGVGTSTPRLSTEVSGNELSIVGAGDVTAANQRLAKVYDNLEVSWNATVDNDLFVLNNLDVTGTTQIDGTLTVGTASVTISDAATNTISRNGALEVATVGVADLTFDVGDSTSSVVTNVAGSPVLTSAATLVSTTVDFECGAIGAWQRIFAENAIVAAGTWHIYDRGAGAITNLICGFGWDLALAGPLGNTSSTFITHNANPPPYAGSTVAMLVLDQHYECATAVITMWRVSQYDEVLSLATGTPVLAAGTSPPAPPANILIPQHTLKGSPPNPGGGTPGTTANGCVQQIEVEFYNLAGIPAAPAVPSGPPDGEDIVFDIKVCGCPCTP